MQKYPPNIDEKSQCSLGKKDQEILLEINLSTFNKTSLTMFKCKTLNDDTT